MILNHVNNAKSFIFMNSVRNLTKLCRNFSKTSSNHDTKVTKPKVPLVIDLNDPATQERLRLYKENEKQWLSQVKESELSESELKIHKIHLKQCQDLEQFYVDPVLGLQVRTRYGHFMRGYCCGNGCRHCVDEHEKVPEDKKKDIRSNSAFYFRI